MPAATAPGSVVVMSLIGDATANTAPMTDAPVISPRLRARLSMPEMTPRCSGGLAPTPRALELRSQVSQLVHDARMVLRPAEQLGLSQLVRTFTIRSREGFIENFGPGLIARVGAEALGVRLCFVQKPDKASTALRDGTVDLEPAWWGRQPARRSVHRRCSAIVASAWCARGTR
jgi:DNA-binding transcriptional LysR family regulator